MSKNVKEAVGEIFLVPFFGSQGHIFSFNELSKKLSSLNFKSTLILSSDLSSSVSSSMFDHPLVNVVAIDAPLPPPPRPGKFDHALHELHFNQMRQGTETFITNRVENECEIPVVCAVVDTMMLSIVGHIFTKFQVPIAAFFPSSSTSLAMDYAAWKADVEYLKPGETRILPGLPEEMAMNYVDIVRRFSTDREFGANAPGTKRKSFPTQPGDEPPWVEEVKGTIAILVNTFVEIEQPFLEYVAKQTGLPVWGVGPMLPEKIWTLCATKTLLRDKDIRSISNHQTNYSEDEIVNWLDSKPPKSVVYISFGSDIMPTFEEHEEIAKALEESSMINFIWVISKNQDYFPNGLESKVGKRGLVIDGWAPQLLILSHKSTGGFMFHSGWNSIMESIGQEVPLLAWPLRGDQYYCAKIIVFHLKIGHMVTYGENLGLKRVKKDEIIQGIKRLMEDEQVHNQVKILSDKFKHGFPASSVAALHDFTNLVLQTN